MCLKLSNCLVLSFTRWVERIMRKYERTMSSWKWAKVKVKEQKKLFLKTCNILVSISRDRLQTQDLYLRRTNSNCAGVIESSGTWMFSPVKFLKLFNLLTSYNFWFGNKWNLDLIVPDFFYSTCCLRTVEKYRSVNPICGTMQPCCTLFQSGNSDDILP